MARAPVTFVIPCRNGGTHLRPLLDSLLDQTCQDFELLLVDDDSSDDSLAIAREACGDRIRTVQNPERLGLGGNWNRCAELVTTPLFCIAHVDDVYKPQFLERMLAAMDARPAAAFAHCRATALDENGLTLASPVERFKDGFWTECLDPAPERQFHLLRRGNFIICPSAVYRTSLFRAVGPFDPSLRATLDWERNVRTALARHPIIGLPETLLGYRRHAKSVTSDNLRTLDRYREEARILRWIDAQGHEVGWLSGTEPPSRALRNNVIYDAFVDLRAGRPDMARARFAFAREEEPALAWDLASRTAAALARTGILGRLLLASILQLVLWRARLGYFIGLRRRSTTTSRTKRP